MTPVWFIMFFDKKLSVPSQTNDPWIVSQFDPWVILWFDPRYVSRSHKTTSKHVHKKHLKTTSYEMKISFTLFLHWSKAGCHDIREEGYVLERNGNGDNYYQYKLHKFHSDN